MRHRLLAIGLSLCLIQAKCPPLRDALKAYGLVEVRPPSSYLMPGTLVWISSDKPLVAGRLCSSERTMGDAWKPSESKTMNTELTRAAKRGINFQVDVQAIVTGNADFKHIKDVSLSLRNARLYELTDADLSDRLAGLDDTCLRAMQRRQRAGFKVSLISSSLVADMQYHVRFENSANLSVQAKIAQLEALSAQLGLESSTVTDRTISAEALVIGARVDDFLAYLYDPAHLEKADRRQSSIPSEWDGFFVSKEDAQATTRDGDSPTLSDAKAEAEYWQSLDISDSESELESDSHGA